MYHNLFDQFPSNGHSVYLHFSPSTNAEVDASDRYYQEPHVMHEDSDEKVK